MRAAPVAALTAALALGGAAVASASALDVAVAPSTASLGALHTVTGAMRDDAGAALAGRRISLQVRPFPFSGRWRTVDHATTDAKGRYAIDDIELDAQHRRPRRRLRRHHERDRAGLHLPGAPALLQRRGQAQAPPSPRPTGPRATCGWASRRCSTSAAARRRAPRSARGGRRSGCGRAATAPSSPSRCRAPSAAASSTRAASRTPRAAAWATPPGLPEALRF